MIEFLPNLVLIEWNSALARVVVLDPDSERRYKFVVLFSVSQVSSVSCSPRLAKAISSVSGIGNAGQRVSRVERHRDKSGSDAAKLVTSN